jgi:hypothetical protein
LLKIDRYLGLKSLSITIVSQARDVIAAPELSGGLGEGAPFESAVEAVLRSPHWLLLQRIDAVLEC